MKEPIRWRSGEPMNVLLYLFTTTETLKSWEKKLKSFEDIPIILITFKNSNGKKKVQIKSENL